MGEFVQRPNRGALIQYIARGVFGTRRLLREKEVDETPQGGFPEEARQLARGKRVVPKTPQPLHICRRPHPLSVSQFRVIHMEDQQETSIVPNIKTLRVFYTLSVFILVASMKPQYT